MAPTSMHVNPLSGCMEEEKNGPHLHAREPIEWLHGGVGGELRPRGLSGAGSWRQSSLRPRGEPRPRGGCLELGAGDGVVRGRGGSRGRGGLFEVECWEKIRRELGSRSRELGPAGTLDVLLLLREIEEERMGRVEATYRDWGEVGDDRTEVVGSLVAGARSVVRARSSRERDWSWEQDRDEEIRSRGRSWKEPGPAYGREPTGTGGEAETEPKSWLDLGEGSRRGRIVGL